MLIKICGMRDAENISAVEALGVDMLGFIFYPRSPRYVGKQLLPTTNCLRVGVFVDEIFDKIVETADRHKLTHIQLHGNESREFCQKFLSTNYKVIKAISVASVNDIEKAGEYDVDYLLFDTKCNNYGGSGRQFDWSILENYTGKIPFFLSGGITPDSASAIINFKHPRLVGIDLNSGFEDSPTVKNIQKLNQFLINVK